MRKLFLILVTLMVATLLFSVVMAQGASTKEGATNLYNEMTLEMQEGSFQAMRQSIVFGLTLEESRIEPYLGEDRRCGQPMGAETIPGRTELMVIKTQPETEPFGQWSLAVFKHNRTTTIGWVQGPIDFGRQKAPLTRQGCLDSTPEDLAQEHVTPMGQPVVFGLTLEESRIEPYLGEDRRCGWTVGMTTIPEGTELLVIQAQPVDKVFGQWSLAIFEHNNATIIGWVQGPIEYEIQWAPRLGHTCPTPPNGAEG